MGPLMVKILVYWFNLTPYIDTTTPPQFICDNNTHKSTALTQSLSYMYTYTEYI